MHNCEICGEYGRHATLAGGLYAILCVEHDREWADVCYASEEYDELSVATEEYRGLLAQLMGGAKIGACLSDRGRVCREKQAAMREVARRWLAEQQAAWKEKEE